MRIGIFGGSFDPIHLGHLLLAEFCRETKALDQVLFIPAFIPPHKLDKKLAAPKHRVEMINLATAGHPQFSVSTIEIEREGTSFTVDTLEQLLNSEPLQESKSPAELFLLMGADSLDEFSTWKSPERICELATPIVMKRRGSAPIDIGKLAPYASPSRLQAIDAAQIENPTIEISSTEIRDRIQADQSVRYQIPRAVEAYIVNHGLYQQD